MTLPSSAAVVLGTAITYGLLFEVNNLLFSALTFSAGVNWIFLPSGLRLAFILVFGLSGALGIALASIVTSLLFFFEGDWLSSIVTGLISGGAPLLARKFCVDFLGLGADLQGLSGAGLLKMAGVFAIISPLMHQLWFVSQGVTQDFWSSTSAMVVGDLLGSLAVLYLARWAMLARRQKI